MPEEQEAKGMKTIWHFVGLLMLVVGLIIFCSGVYYYAYPPKETAEMYYLHPDIWWGLIMGIFGGVLLWAFKGKTVES